MFIPLPAVIFLCSVIILLIALALLYFFLRKHECCKMEGKAEEEEELIDGTDPSSKEENSKKTAIGELETAAATVNGSTLGQWVQEGGGTMEGVADALAQQVTGEGAGKDAVDAPEVTSEQPGPSNGTTTNEQSGAPGARSGGGAGGAKGGLTDGATGEAYGSGDEIPQDDLILEDPVPPVDFIESEETEPLAIAGKVLVQFTYMPAANKVNLTLIRIGDMPPVERGGSETVQAHLCVLPMRKQRFRTKAVPVSKGVFNETFQFIHMTKDLVETCAIRLRIYGTQRFSKRLIGEVKMPLSKLDLTSPLADEQIWKNLSPKGLVAYIGNVDEDDSSDEYG